MKKLVIVAAVLGGLIGVTAVVYGARQGWFSRPAPDSGSAPETQQPVKRPDRPPSYEDPGTVVTTQGLARLESLKNASDTDMVKALAEWAKQAGIERKISWEAVCKGALPEAERKTRLRACQLAAALASGRPEGMPVPPPAEERAMGPLMSCLASGDPGMVQAAVNALGSINIHSPACKVEEKAIPEVKKLLAGEDAALASAALSAAAFFAEPGMAPEVLAAWEKHEKSPGFAEKARDNLKILMELRLREGLKKEHPDWSKEKCLTEAKPKVQELAGQFGKDLGKWREWWAAPAPMP